MLRIIICLFTCSIIFSCTKEPSDNPTPDQPINNPVDSDTTVVTLPMVFDLPADSAPYFVGACYIDLNKIGMISKFRSGFGHDYSDDFEFCRSMKHYYTPLNNSADSISIYSPVKGKVVRMFSEWAGNQVQIRSDEYPAFVFILFHVNSFSNVQENVNVEAGELLGYHVGTMTSSDIAVKVSTSVDGPKADPQTEQKIRYFSIFHVMNDSIFNLHQQKGVISRDEAIITEAERDNSSLNCNGQAFLDQGTLPNWVTLTH
jgi:hypothetical protein